MSTKFGRLEFLEKTLPLPKTSWPKQEKSGTPMIWVDLSFEWYEYAMVLCVLIFIFFV